MALDSHRDVFGTATSQFLAADAAHVAACRDAGGFVVSVKKQDPVASPAGLRRVQKLPLAQLTPNTPGSAPPRFALIDPETLLVDERYQRAISAAGMKLIRRMVAGWDWKRFKPPVVVKHAEGFEVVDGQHTAVAAACHPHIAQIPVMVVQAAELADRASAFVGHNRERVNLTSVQIHIGAATAGDAAALAVNQVCEAAGVTIARFTRSDGFKPRETVALGAINALIKRRSAEEATAVLKILAEAECAPVGAGWIKAVDLLLHDPAYADTIITERLPALIRDHGAEIERDAALFATAKGLVQWKALAAVAYRKSPKRRAAA